MLIHHYHPSEFRYLVEESFAWDETFKEMYVLPTGIDKLIVGLSLQKDMMPSLDACFIWVLQVVDPEGHLWPIHQKRIAELDLRKEMIQTYLQECRYDSSRSR